LVSLRSARPRWWNEKRRGDSDLRRESNPHGITTLYPKLMAPREKADKHKEQRHHLLLA
jgi:hypothetical protein